MNKYRRGLALGALALAVFILIGVGISMRATPQPVNLTQVLTDIRDGRVTEIHLANDGQAAEVTYTDESKTRVALPAGESLTTLLTDAGIPVERWPDIYPAGNGAISADLMLLLRILTIVAVGVVIFVLFRRFGPSSIGTTPTRRGSFEPIRPGERVITFDDVAGAEEVKEEVADIVDYLRDPERFRRLGARIPRGVLLTGPPGTGKTLLTRALAGEARASFFSVSGSEFVELYVGVGASRVRELFRKAKENAPAIIFIDEIDAIGRRRGRMEQSSEYDQTLNQILVEMDGFEERTTVVVVAATNRVDILDPALLRPGRFDRKVVVDLPDRKARRAILEVHARGKPLAENVNLDELAARTTGMTGADLANVINEAAILAARDRRETITNQDLLEALDRTLAGPARNARRFSERERRVVAYHEAGHAVVAHLLPHADPVRKVSIVSRGRAGGYTMIVPDEDRGLWTRAQLSDRLAALLGGLAAEELIFGDITTGSSNDLEQTTAIATSMVQRYGMGKRFGLLSTGAGSDLQQLSPQSAYTAEQEALELVQQAHQVALDVLRAHADDLERVAQRLLEVETIDGEELETLISPPRQLPVRRPVEQALPTPLHRAPIREGRRKGSAHRVGRAIGLVASFTRDAVESLRAAKPQIDRT
ncbi:MAG: ATP-dependent zinc metalloprotease FtsH [Sphaerobacter thermophilus]|uniref:ATP-dependent zinc metalloprotease FtsH 2 n=1 Tax=Sphaerobacter thermophilus (strain ATCC 49802 / DSM 20745 / KCCM 41009 / NCIMB 13125 / S 6022) TaxID=479434 RepID=FTSH2_SPHTD|nr:ATP-dependent zinc metalloprotease FtsH [Sphaerobacter thermophilus]D1C2C6.1 RecName: Full=ATP-dependent zinc metalloprotease FtsH 2 [Sphaerobacter thermophilus DSM 20745]ACZ38393.1 ATP-dependent metalloprotease FtsH [Sphaerobacter thermophilus DSM 20745]